MNSSSFSPSFQSSFHLSFTVLKQHSALDGVYHPFWPPLPSKPTVCNNLVLTHTQPRQTLCSNSLWHPVPRTDLEWLRAIPWPSAIVILCADMPSKSLVYRKTHKTKKKMYLIVSLYWSLCFVENNNLNLILNLKCFISSQ